MTRAQFARSVDADEKWVENSAALLNRRMAYTPQEACWFGLVRLLTRNFEIPVARAATLADRALGESPAARAVHLAGSEDESTFLVLDLARYYSSFTTRLSAALHHAGPARLGRPRSSARRRERDPIARAEAYGVDLTLLREGLRLSPAERLSRLDANVAFLRALRPTHSPEHQPTRSPVLARSAS